VIVSDTRKGPMRVVIEAHGGALALFVPAERAKVVKRGLREAGMMWLYKWMPRRFTAYAYFLGYRVSNKWKALKQGLTGSSAPFVGLTPSGGGQATGPWWQRNGAKMADAVRAGRVTASGKSEAESLTIKVPYGHPIQTDKSTVFRTIAPREMDEIAEVLGRRVANEISGGKTVMRQGEMRKIAKPKARTISAKQPRKVG
jgi:hypothetical protein